ncbi:AarF/UbiB family protein [uncultured Cohaesibacter sp.]|uniref:ABC1 kinase family protein n=1 Tax=uncultured Cohaesibacter sp. TaxID=1002546 RepID=UPI0029C6DBDC|nr:AarF/UbiB family protein [uncultured Cohaesibacter sp.]
MADDQTSNRPDSEDNSKSYDDENRFGGRMKRYARVNAGMGGFVARAAGTRLLGRGGGDDISKEAADLARVLGNLKGPLMKVAQMLATVPDIVPPEYSSELAQLQADAPPMGWAFVKRRMRSELGPDWRSRFANFEHEPSAAASLGQVHKAFLEDGSKLACKLQYPDMASAVEADLKQLDMLFAVHRNIQKAIDNREVAKELGDRVREELDYIREAWHMDLYHTIFRGIDFIRVPQLYAELSTPRLLSMGWLDGSKLLNYRDHSQEDRNYLTKCLFHAWWYPFAHHGLIHGDPHLGNYTVFEEEGRVGGINLFDYGCIRIFPPTFVQGVVNLYHGLLAGNREQVVHAYETWGFSNLSDDLVDALNVWAEFIYGPMLDDRVRSIADGISPMDYGRKQAFRVGQELKRLGPVTVPREFVFMNRAAVGLGGVFLHLKAELNFYEMFNEQIEDFSVERVFAARRRLPYSPRAFDPTFGEAA